jgi:DcuC family C4-dicarboxylate transporter
MPLADLLQPLASLAVIAVTVVAILRRAEVRLTLLLAALALGVLAGRPMVIVRSFLDYFTSEQFLVPLGCSMGFAYVLRHTDCDQHLIHLLIRPLGYVRPLLVPGVAVVGLLVNVPVISQASTAVAVGTVLVPILRAARVSPVTAGAALLLGSSLGGDMLNPGAPEWRTVSHAVNSTRGQLGAPAAEVRGVDCVTRTAPLLLVEAAVAVGVFWLVSWRADARRFRAEAGAGAAPDGRPAFRVNLVKALVPLVPLTLLFLTALPPPFRAFGVPREWLMPARPHPGASFDSRLIGLAMVVGAVLAALTDRRKAAGTAKMFFEGVGYAFTNIISVIVAANCFGDGVKESGLAVHLERAVTAAPGLLLPAAAGLPMGFAWICGSGMASTQSFYRFFLGPAEAAGEDPLLVGGVVALSAAGGRTLSPVAAVVLLCASLSGAEPLGLVRRLVLPVAAGVAALLLAAALLGRA